MIGALVSLLSLDMTRKLVAAGMVASTFTITGATNATPIVLTTSTAHGLTRRTHAVVSGVVGNVAANGLWVMTPTSTTQLALSTFESDGTPVNSVGSGAYTSGGLAKTAFPDGSIRLGRRNVPMASAVATPRIVFVPVGSSEWKLDPYGGAIPAASRPPARVNQTAEQQTMLQRRQLNTERQKFEVHVTGCATPPDPDFGDFDVTQAIYQSLYESMFNLITPDRARVLGGNWVSQVESIQTLDTRGQKWVGVVEIAQAVADNPLSFVNANTDGTLVVNFDNGDPADETVIVVP